MTADLVVVVSLVMALWGVVLIVKVVASSIGIGFSIRDHSCNKMCTGGSLLESSPAYSPGECTTSVTMPRGKHGSRHEPTT